MAAAKHLAEMLVIEAIDIASAQLVKAQEADE